nr:MAG TPA: Ig-like domain protein [Caudoviricetes sp.]
MLTYNEDARAYQTTITPDTFSGGQPDGYYDVTVEATNDSGVVVTTDGDNLPGLRLVVRETIPPILTLVSPEAGYVTTNTPAVTWTAQDNDGGSGIDPDSAMVKLDGKAVPAEQVSVTAGAGGTYTITYTPGAALAEGPHTVQAGISDNDGNTATMEANYIVDTVPPALSALLSFEEVVVDPYTVTITGQTNDATAPPVTMTVMDNGAVAGHPTVGPDGRFSFLLNLEVGDNNVTVVAKDGAGLTTPASYYIIRMVTDRTQADVDALNDRGTYNASDLNRVNTAMKYIDSWLKSAGYVAGYIKQGIAWAKEDIPTVEQMRRYLDNVEALRTALAGDAKLLELPSSIDLLTYTGANRIEKALVLTDKLRPLLARSAFMSGEIFCGEV